MRLNLEKDGSGSTLKLEELQFLAAIACTCIEQNKLETTASIRSPRVNIDGPNLKPG